jgi:hypothetical protein
MGTGLDNHFTDNLIADLEQLLRFSVSTMHLDLSTFVLIYYFLN